MNDNQIIHSLKALGFTQLEAQIYKFLVSESPATGYRIAKAIRKPAANTYKALETLEQKGAVLIDKSKKRQYRSVNYTDMLNRLERKFLHSKQQAVESLAELKTADWDDNVYQIQSKEQVYDQFRTMLKRAKRIAIIDTFPEILDDFHAVIRTEIDRGLTVLIKAYQPVEIAGAKIVPESRAKRYSSKWDVQWMNLVIDASEYLIVLLSEAGDVYQAVYTRSPMLSYLYHHGIHTELVLDEVIVSLQDRKQLADIERIVAEFEEISGGELLDVAALTTIFR
ncbi:MAG: TrmB family transcriptional regulator [Candidatus Marinimicrobia bacterium]|nr:TrmB family transcriptional regulator [Candidatus Neomarinimicrobiota bacterium]